MRTSQRPPSRARVAVARERGDERAEVQRTGRGGREAAAVHAVTARVSQRRAAAMVHHAWCRGRRGASTAIAARRAQHRVRIFGAPEAAVVAAERAEVVAVLDVEIVAQDHAAVAQVGAQVEEVVLGAADQPRPERHHLHVAARARDRDRVLLEAALVLDHAEHELRIEPGARRLVVDGGEELAAIRAVVDAVRRAAATFRRPTARRRPLGVVGGHRIVGDRALQSRDDRRREPLLDLRAGAAPAAGASASHDKAAARTTSVRASRCGCMRLLVPCSPLRQFGQPRADPRGDLAHRHRRGRRVAASLVLDFAVLEAAIADGDPVRNPDQLEISKHHARTLAAVVQQDVDARPRRARRAACRRTP